MNRLLIIFVSSFLVGFGSAYVWFDRLHTKELLEKEEAVTSYYEKKLSEQNTTIEQLHKIYNEVYNENQTLVTTNRELAVTADRLRNDLQNGRIEGSTESKSCVDSERYNGSIELLSEGAGLLQEGTELLRKLTVEKDLLINQIK